MSQPDIYTVLCIVLGEDVPFSVEIQKSEIVDKLKKRIKEENPITFADIEAKFLDLYLIDIPSSELDERMKNLQLESFPQLKDVTASLEELFGGAPGTRTIHILVKHRSIDPPITSRTKRRKREALVEEQETLKKLVKVAPSSLAKPSAFKIAAEGAVYCNRPFNYDTIPIDLFQPEFGEFKKDCAMPPTTWAQNLLQRLTESACKWYDNETHRRSEIHEALKDAELYLAAETISGTECKTDGNWKVNIMPPAIRKCKNESGCALLEAIAYYAQFLRIALPSYRHARFPCILMVDVAFYGCLWTGEQIHVEPLTPNYDLTTHWTDEVARNAIASSLDAFKKTTARLESYYRTLALAPSVNRTFPYPTSYEDDEGQTIHFTYHSRIEDKLVFSASVDGNVENTTLCVKFTKRYLKDAHQFLTSLGHAPQLRGVTSLPADWIMVVMDLSQYVRLSELPPQSVESRNLVRSKIREIVHKLHNNGFVHGDIRETNILVDSETLTSKAGCSVHLIDFDWAGEDGKVKYPGRVNTVSVRRPDGVSDGELITKSHDMDMVTWLLI